MEKSIQIIEGTKVEVNNNEVVVSGKKGELKRKFFHPQTILKKDGDRIIVTSNEEGRKNGAIMGTWMAHIKNMMIGVNDGYQVNMKIVHRHFPMTVKAQGNQFSVQNIFGQKAPKKIEITEGVEIKIEGEDVEIKGIDKEAVGNVMSNIEKICKKGIRRDKRVFYDGIYKVDEQ